MLRFIPKSQGGFFKSPGTLVCGHSYSNLSCRLVPFVVSQTQGYVLEFTNQLVRVWLNGVMIGNVVTAAMTLGVSPYLTADIPSLQFYSAFPDLFITHRGYPPARIRWTTPNTLTMTVLTFSTNTITFIGNTYTTVTLDTVPTNLLPTEDTWFLTDSTNPANITAGTYITAIAQMPGTTNFSLTLSQAANGSYTGDSFVLTLQPAPFASVGNYPRTCGVFFQRLYFANTATFPQDVWASGVGIYDPILDPTGSKGIVYMRWSEISSFSVPILSINTVTGSPNLLNNQLNFVQTPTFQDLIIDSDAFNYTLNSQYDDEVAWIANAIDIAIGSASGTWIAPGISTANNFSADIVANDGAEFIQPLFVTGGMLFVQRGGQKIYRFEWQGSSNPFIPPEEITFFSDHLFINNAIQQETIQNVPERNVWYLRADGTCAVLVWDHVHKTQAWWRFQTNGKIVGLASAPGTDLQGNGGRDLLYLAVQRTIGATTYTFIETLATPYWASQPQAIFSDCATYKYNAVKFTTITVDTGLVGATVELVCDGAYKGTAVVGAAGLVTLPVSCNYAVCGINYTSQMTSMPIVPQENPGSEMKKSSIPKAVMRVYNTLSVFIGQFTTPNVSGISPLTPVPLGEVPLKYTTALPTPYSGPARSSILEALRDDCYLSIVSNLPLPCAVTAIVPDLEVAET